MSSSDESEPEGASSVPDFPGPGIGSDSSDSSDSEYEMQQYFQMV